MITPPLNTHVLQNNSPVEPPSPAKSGPVNPAPESATQLPSNSLKPDHVDMKVRPQASQPQAAIKLFDEPTSSKHGPDKPWKVTSMHVNAGYIVQHDVLHTGPMKIQNPDYGTDLTITGIKQQQRTSFEYLQIKPGQRFAPDEPQFNIGVNVGFANKFGAELDIKHNKVTNGDYSQNVHFEGMMNGEYVNYDAPLNSYMTQHEQTYGNMQFSVLGTRSFDLPAPDKHRFSFITKAGPSLVTAATRTTLLNPEGGWDHQTSPIAVVGYGVELENALRYELGPKAGRMGIEVGHAFSYLNYANYATVGGSGGTGSHDALSSQFTVKLTKTFPFKK